MEFLRSDEFLAMFVPVVVYWAYSGMYMVLFGSSNKYRLHSKKDEDVKNLVSKKDVFKGVILQQALQAAITYVGFMVTGSNHYGEASSSINPSLMVVSCQFLVAMFVHDTWQYFMHRFMHLNKFLYRNFHSMHHRLVVPYAFGAQYNHPLDGLLIETVAAMLAFVVSGMSPRTSIYFISFATIKGIDDHCGYMIPWNPFHLLFSNNAAYHDIHHQLAGNKCNFAQPFFVMWDKAFGTYVPYSLEKRAGGGFEARVVVTKEEHKLD